MCICVRVHMVICVDLYVSIHATVMFTCRTYRR